MDYRPEVDGLRALAVISVILFHAGFTTFSGGFVGVDVFFVISGYLITSIIISEQQRRTFSLARFYERRARRILPPLFLMMAVCLPFAWFWLAPPNLRNFSQSLVAVAAFASNFLFWKTSGYFAGDAELKPLLHTWSLAVEEQFYLFFPVLLMFTWKLGKRFIVSLLIIAAIVSLALAQWASVKQPDTGYYLLPTRGWELLIGALIAFGFSGKKPNFSNAARQIGGAAGIGLISYSIFRFDRNTPFPGLYALVPTVGTALIILFANPETWVGRALANRWVVGIGLISYSAYLWHQPLFAFARQRLPGEPTTALMVALSVGTLLLAYISWKFVERPFRDKKFIDKQHLVGFAIAGSSMFAALGLAGHLNWGYRRLLTSEEKAILSIQKYDYSGLYREGLCFLRPEQKYSDFSAECRTIEDNKDVLFLWGDSYAASLSGGLRATHKNFIQYTASSCPPVMDVVVAYRQNCLEINNFVFGELKSIRPSQVVLVANWFDYKKEKAIPLLAESLRRVKEATPDSRITVIGSYPHWYPILPSLIVDSGVSLNQVQYMKMPMYPELSAVDALLNALCAHNNVNFVSALKTFCHDDGTCEGVVQSDNKYTLPAWDVGHLTEAGSRILARQISPN